MKKGMCTYLQEGHRCPVDMKPLQGLAAKICVWVASREEELNSLHKGEIQIFFAGHKVSGKIIEFVERVGT